MRERKKERTRETIAKAAMRLFLRKGFAATTVEDIAATADISPRTFFRYFPSKEDVIFGHQQLEDQAVIDALKQRSPEEDDMDALRRVLSAVPRAFDAPDETTELIRLVVTTPELLARGATIVANSVERIAGALAGGSTSRTERRRAHLRVGAYVGAYLAGMLSQLQQEGRIDLDVVVHEVGAVLTTPRRPASPSDSTLRRGPRRGAAG